MYVYMYVCMYAFIFVFREGEERDRNINVSLPLVRPLLGACPTSQACALGMKTVTLWFIGWHSIH